MFKSVRKFSFLVNPKSKRFSTYKFQTAIQTTLVSESNYKATLVGSWNIGDSPNGGYVMSVAVNAAQQSLKLKDLLSFSACYISKAEEGPADISVEILNNGNSKAIVRVLLSQGGELRSSYQGIFTDFSKYKGVSHNVLRAPELPPIAECLDGNACLKKNFGNHLIISHNTEFRIPKDHPFAVNFLMTGKPGGDAFIDCWLGFPDGEPPSLESFPLFLDFCPPVLNLKETLWVPTLNYSIDCLVKPQPEHMTLAEGKSWIRARFMTNFVKDGLLVTDAELWSGDGKVLLGKGTQRAMIWSPRKT